MDRFHGVISACTSSYFAKQIERIYAEADAARDKQPEPKYGFWLGELAHWRNAGWLERIPNGYDPDDMRWPMNDYRPYVPR